MVGDGRVRAAKHGTHNVTTTRSGPASEFPPFITFILTGIAPTTASATFTADNVDEGAVANNDSDTDLYNGV